MMTLDGFSHRRVSGWNRALARSTSFPLTQNATPNRYKEDKAVLFATHTSSRPIDPSVRPFLVVCVCVVGDEWIS